MYLIQALIKIPNGYEKNALKNNLCDLCAGFEKVAKKIFYC
jgi:hypothetical protein